MIVRHIINDLDLRRGGAQRVVNVLHSGLLERGVDSRVICLTGHNTDTPFVTHLGSRNPRSPIALLKLAMYLRNNQVEGEVLHSHLFPSNLYTCIAARLAGSKAARVTTEHNTTNRRRGTRLGKYLDTFLYQHYDRIACISVGTLEALEQWLPAIKGRCSLIYNGVDLSFSAFSRLQDAPRSTVTIISVGRLHNQKNYGLALQSLSRLESDRWQYLIAGTGSEEKQLKETVEKLGLKHNVKFLGYVDNIPALLGKADIFLMPSRWEGFGLAAVEAMNAGLPLVVSDVDGLREVVSDKSAFVISGNNPSDYAIALSRLVQDPGLRFSMGQSAFVESKKFEADTMIDNYLRLYESLL